MKKTVYVFFLIVCLAFFCACKDSNNEKSNEVVEEIVEINNPYNFDNVDKTEFEGDGYPPEEYRKALEINKNIPDDEEHSKAVITIYGEEISKKKFISQKNILKLQNESVSDKAVVYVLLEPIVLRNEAERLKVEPKGKEALLEEYVEDLKEYFSSGQKAGYPEAYMEYYGYTQEEYIEEAKQKLYDSWKHSEMYRNANKNGKYKNFDEYVSDLIKKSDLKIYDEQLDLQCR